MNDVIFEGSNSGKVILVRSEKIDKRVVYIYIHTKSCY